jgi:O-antigen ligase
VIAAELVSRGATSASTKAELATQPRSRDRAPWVGLAIGVVILVGIALGSVPLQLAGSVAAFGAALVSPFAGLATLAFMVSLKSPPAIAAPGFNTLLVIAILIGYVYRLPIDRPRLRPSAPILLLLGYILYVAVQQLPAFLAGYADDTSHHIGYLFIQLATLVTLAVAATLVLRGRNHVPFLAAGLLGALIAAVLAIAVYVLPVGSVGSLVDYPDATVRVVGPFGDPNYFGLFQATAIAACGGAFVLARSSRIRFVLAAVAVILLIGMAIALSRAALLALAIGLIAMAFTRGRRIGFLTIGLLAALAITAYPLFLVQRLTADAGALSVAQASVGLQRSDASRLAAALVGPQMWATSPIFGIGFGEYPLTTSRFIGYSIESHNWYMNILAEQGLVGVALWIPMLAATALRVVRLEPIARTIGVAVFVTYVVGSTFLEPPLSVQTSAFAVIVTIAALVGDWSRLPGRAHPQELPLDEPEPPVAARSVAAHS